MFTSSFPSFAWKLIFFPRLHDFRLMASLWSCYQSQHVTLHVITGRIYFNKGKKIVINAWIFLSTHSSWFCLPKWGFVKEVFFFTLYVWNLGISTLETIISKTKKILSIWKKRSTLIPLILVVPIQAELCLPIKMKLLLAEGSYYRIQQISRLKREWKPWSRNSAKI